MIMMMNETGQVYCMYTGIPTNNKKCERKNSIITSFTHPWMMMVMMMMT